MTHYDACKIAYRNGFEKGRELITTKKYIVSCKKITEWIRENKGIDMMEDDVGIPCYELVKMIEEAYDAVMFNPENRTREVNNDGD